MISNKQDLQGSFRDPGGFLFIKSGAIYRQINNCYKEDYDFLINSGLYAELLGKNLIIHHFDVDSSSFALSGAYKIIRPERLPFISYPHEWCFSQLKDAALTTLQIQDIAIKHGMILKDASAYNIQFRNGKPLLIDTLSFERYQEGRPWIAYRQFCQHFLIPLALISYKDHRLNQLLRIFIDGIPLDLASKLLPARSFFSPSMNFHIHMHAKAQKYFGMKKINPNRHSFGRRALFGLVDNLRLAIMKLNWIPPKSEWDNYYSATHYSIAARDHKRRLIAEALQTIKPSSVWDLGANTGVFSRIASGERIMTISFDIDYAMVEKNYKKCTEENESHILPLFMDLSNPTSGFGWAHQERMSLQDRGPADAVLALGLIHHLRISNNIPLDYIAEFLAKISRWLIIEFVPKNDIMVQTLLFNRQDIYWDYCQEIFERAFKNYFRLILLKRIEDSERYIYIFQEKEE
jgi:hypothetical protein